jgi:DivIVA domain-containing protein
MANGQSDLVSPDDVRHVEFNEARRGYDRDEVHAFLDRVILTLEELGRRLRAARQSGSSTASASAPAEAGLHDPDGAAQRLLAAAQRTADQLVHDAGTQATQLSAEADQYAVRVRRDADDYAAGITGQADEHAALIRATAADEARRVAEELRAGLVDEINDLEALRDSLLGDRHSLESHLSSQRARLGEVLAALQLAIEGGVGELELDAVPELSGASAADAAAVTASAGSTAPPMTDSSVSSVFDTAGDEPGFLDVGADDGADFFGSSASAAPTYHDEADDDIDDEIDGGYATSSSHDTREHPFISADESAETGGFFHADDDLDDDDEEAPIFGEAARRADGGDDMAFEPRPHERSIFDIEAERFDEPTLAVPMLDLDLDDDDPEPAPPSPPGEAGGFFDELRAPAADDLFGEADEDTDAALAAFFDQDEDEEDERWRRRFGPRR